MMANATIKENPEIIRVIHMAGQAKPWQVNLDGIHGFKKIRAVLNYPVTKFETEAKALDVANMLGGIIKADGVMVDGATIPKSNQIAEGGFYHEVHAEHSLI
jgi:hypothetical protein